ncbi:MAG TPA: endonuclease/exonuclease/phosphatase family protein [Chitinophagaceae bacterium]
MINKKPFRTGMKIFGVLFFGLMMLACNKKPYMPDTPPITIELGNADDTYGSNNDDMALIGSLKAMTYNIHILNPPSKPDETDINATAKVILDGNPDVVFLQEVDKNTGRNNFDGDQAKELAKLTKMNFAFYSASPVGRGMYGVALLSKYPLKNIKKFLLTKESAATEQRVLGTAIVDLPGKDSMILAVTHLQHNSASNRLQQVKDVVSILGTLKERIIIGGDFNEFESTTEFFNVFDGSFTRTCKGVNCPPTFSAQLPKSVIDYVAYKPSSAFAVKNHQVISEYYASDHLPVMAELNLIR